MSSLVYRVMIFFVLVLYSCSETEEPTKLSSLTSLEVGEDNSYSNIYRVNTKHLHLDLDVNFENKIIYGVARHEVENNHADTAIFDIHGLQIQKVTIGKKGNEKNTSYLIGIEDSIHGAPLSVLITPKTRFINIYYQTTELTNNLHWKSETKKIKIIKDSLSKDSVAPTITTPTLLYTLPGEKYTRNWIPLQDVSYKKISYSATVKVPKEMIPLMGTDNPTHTNDSSIYFFESNNPVPVYDIGLTVGKYSYKRLSNKCGVYYSSPNTFKYTKEFNNLPFIVKNIKQFYGKSPWKSINFVLLSPTSTIHNYQYSQLYFVNPSFLSSYQNSNRNLEHFLLENWATPFFSSICANNKDFAEGITSYYLTRLVTLSNGKEQGELASNYCINSCLLAVNSDFIPDYSLKNIYSSICTPKKAVSTKERAYKQLKSFLLLKTLEQTLGKEKLDRFIKNYLNSQSNHTIEDFEHELNHYLIQNEVIRFPLKNWLYGKKIPRFTYKISSKRHLQLHILVKTFLSSKKFLKQKKTIKLFKHFTSDDWQTFISLLPKNIDTKKLAQLDQKFHLSYHPNKNIQFPWLKFGIKSNYLPVFQPLKQILLTTNDPVILFPFQTCLNETEKGKLWMRENLGTRVMRDE